MNSHVKSVFPDLSMDMDSVCLYNSEREWGVRTCVLSAASSVLQTIFEGSSTDNRRIFMDHESAAIDVFLSLAHVVSYDHCPCTDLFQEVISPTDTAVIRLINEDVLTMIHKYETYGIHKHVCTMLRKSPDAPLVIRICTLFPDDTEWCDATICACVAKHLEYQPYEVVALIPAQLLARLWMWQRRAMQIFRPAVTDDRSLTLARQVM